MKGSALALVPVEPARIGLVWRIRVVCYNMTIVFAVALMGLAWGANRADAAEVIRGPYLQHPRTDAMVVKWRTDDPVTSGVWFGTSPESLTESVTMGPAKTDHRIELTGLEPETQYYYAVGTATGQFPTQNPHQTFETAAPAGTVRPFRTWIFGDSGWVGLVQAQLQATYLEYSNGETPDVWLLLGDNSYPDGFDDEYQFAFFDPFANMLAATPVWSTRGNHDEEWPGENNDYYEHFEFPTNGEAGGVPSGTEAYYSFDYANAHFVCLDSEGSSREPNSPMLNWLAADLAATTQEWVIAYWHHAAYTKGSHDSDSEYRPIQMRENIMPVLEDYGVDLVLTGHSHSYERSLLFDGHYGASDTFEQGMVVSGGDGDPNGNGAYVKPMGRIPHSGSVSAVVGTGSIVYPGDFDHPVMVRGFMEYGALIVEIDGPRMDAVFLDETGQVRDQFALQKLEPASTPDEGEASTEPSPSRLMIRATPNPMIGEDLRIDLALPEPATVQVAVYDASGRELRVVHQGNLPAGRHDLLWDGKDSSGVDVGAGVYFLRLNTGGEEIPVKVVRRAP